jgi:uncharacterized OB-fold protein
MLVERPLPLPTEDTEGYWESCHKRQLVTSRCSSCGHHFLPPAPICPACLSEEVRFSPVSGRAKVFSFIVVHRPQHPAFFEDAPYVVAIVELEEGPRMHTRLWGVKNEDIRVGMPVEIVFQKVDDEISLPIFKPIGVPVDDASKLLSPVRASERG